MTNYSKRVEIAKPFMNPAAIISALVLCLVAIMAVVLSFTAFS